jgi:phosphoglycolate phosphatase-like HAD superfamily hydrolase
MRRSVYSRSLPRSGLLLLCIASVASADEVLPSWNDGPSKRAIVKFVTEVTTTGSPTFVPVADRLAVFDNDGTLWCEQPFYFQFAFALDRVKAVAPKHPEWKTQEPFSSILRGDPKGLIASGEKGLAAVIAATHAGMTTDEFTRIAKDWFATAKHPRYKRPYTDLTYKPMVELLGYLRDNGFKTFIVSGGGVEFIRIISDSAYGIPTEQVVGSTGELKLETGPDGKPVLLRLPNVSHVDDGPGKPVGIQRFIGRRPIFAFGNSDGDKQMLEWTAAGDGPRFMALVHHTDAGREYAYDRTFHVGKLDKALDEATAQGWTVVDMKQEWKRVFGFE